MGEPQVVEAGTFEETSPAAVLATALAIGYYGCLTLYGPQTRHTLYLTGGAIAAGAAAPLQDVLAAALALETGGYELSGEQPDAFSIHEPWRALQTAALGILGKARLKLWARRLRGVRVEPVASPLLAWAQGIPEAAHALAQVGGRDFADAIGAQPRLRTLVNLALLREIGLIDWAGEASGQGSRPLVWRDVETQVGEGAAPYEVTDITDAGAPPAEIFTAPPVGEPGGAEDATGPLLLEVEITTETTGAAAAAAEQMPQPGGTEIELTRDVPDATGSSPVADAQAVGAVTAADAAPATPGAVGTLLDGSAFIEGLTFLRQGSLGAAKYRFEDHLQFHPDDLEAAAYVTWIDLQEDLRDTSARRAALASLDLALARKRTADLLTFKGSVLRLDAKFNESLSCLEEALRLEPGLANARYEREQVRLRMRNDEWPEVNVEDVRVDAAIILQRRIGSQVRIYSFKQPEIRVGSSDNDDVVVSEAVLPQVARRHCTVSCQSGRIWVRRNASLGRVFVNGREIEIRKDVPVGADDCVRLGEGAPCLEFKAFGINHLHDLGVLATGGIR